MTEDRYQAIVWYRKAAAAGNEPAKAALKSLGAKDRPYFPKFQLVTRRYASTEPRPVAKFQPTPAV
jgi:TPR repeat protein